MSSHPEHDEDTTLDPEAISERRRIKKLEQEERAKAETARLVARRQEVLSRMNPDSPTPRIITAPPSVRDKISQVTIAPELVGSAFFEVYGSVPLIICPGTLGLNPVGEHFRYLGGRTSAENSPTSDTVPIPSFVFRTAAALGTLWNWTILRGFIVWQPRQSWICLLARTEHAEASTRGYGPLRLQGPSAPSLISIVDAPVARLGNIMAEQPITTNIDPEQLNLPAGAHFRLLGAPNVPTMTGSDRLDRVPELVRLTMEQMGVAWKRLEQGNLTWWQPDTPWRSIHNWIRAGIDSKLMPRGYDEEEALAIIDLRQENRAWSWDFDQGLFGLFQGEGQALSREGLVRLDRVPEFELANPSLRLEIHRRRNINQANRDHAPKFDVGTGPPEDRVSRFFHAGYRPTRRDLVLTDRLNFEQTPLFIHDLLLPLRHQLQLAIDRGEVKDDLPPPEVARPDDEIDDDSFDRISDEQDYTEARLRCETASSGSRQQIFHDEMIVPALHGRPIKDDEYDPIYVHLLGPKRLTVYREGLLSDGSVKRKLAGPMEAVKVMARACQLFLPRDATEDATDDEMGDEMSDEMDYSMEDATEAPMLEERLMMDRPPNGENIPSAYVGICGITLQPAFMRPKLNDHTNTAAGIQIIAEPTQQECERNTIMHEGVTVAGNLTKMKTMMLHNDTQFLEEPDPIGKVLKQNARLIEYVPAEPVMNIRPTAAGRGQPCLEHLYKELGGADSHYQLRVPPLGVWTPSPVLLERLNLILDAHPFDPVPLNIALQAAVVWCDIETSLDRQIEGIGKVLGDVEHPVPYVTIEVFVIYYPHWLRFHEVFKLTRYIHPHRFIHMAYCLDQGRRVNVAELKVREDLIDEPEITRLIQTTKLNTWDFDPKTRITLLPASWPGTQMFWPRQVPKGEMPGDGLAAACLLDDIRTLGLPSYHPRDTSFQLLGIPKLIADQIVRQQNRVRIWVPESPFHHIWAPYRKGSLVAVSGNAATVGPVFWNIQSIGSPLPF
ncbi:hypothetical protein NM208_g10071 [Fusarium decemcellulare]|uniref:Uncharacterized protein n=1 Tax=Fusarium decemcellulare TaxID=57161 RepID=A0ACC1RZ76_9HYPO|nr:hypothetical protein NM208_g10071 [Fusarium decemcellulare]